MAAFDGMRFSEQSQKERRPSRIHLHHTFVPVVDSQETFTNLFSFLQCVVRLLNLHQNIDFIFRSSESNKWVRSLVQLLDGDSLESIPSGVLPPLSSLLSLLY